MATQIRIGDLLEIKESPLTDDDFFVIDNITTNKTYKIRKEWLFAIENLDEISTAEQRSPNKLSKTNSEGLLSKSILEVDLHEHKSGTFTAEPNYLYTLDSTLTSFSGLLPADPPNGSLIIFADWARKTNLNPVTLYPSSTNTVLNDSYLELDVEGLATAIVFYNNNWSLAK